MSPTFYKKGASWKINPREADPAGQYYKSMNAHLQRKLEALPPPTPVTTLAQMSPEKQEEMKALYGRGPRR